MAEQTCDRSVDVANRANSSKRVCRLQEIALHLSLAPNALCATMLSLLSFSATAYSPSLGYSLVRPSLARSFLAMSVMQRSTTFNLDECILSANSEDEVGQCMAIADENAPFDLDECIVWAENEDEVTQCMRIADELKLDHTMSAAAKSKSHSVMTATFDLEECIVAAKSEDEVAQCMAIWDEFEPATEAAAVEPMEQLDVCILNAKSEVCAAGTVIRARPCQRRCPSFG